MKQLTRYFCEHYWKGMAAFFFMGLLLFFIPILNMIAPIGMLLIALQNDRRIGVIAIFLLLLSQCISTIYIESLWGTVDLFFSKSRSILFFASVLFSFVYYCFFILSMKKGVSFQKIFQIAALGAVLIISVLHLFNPAINLWLREAMVEMVQRPATSVLSHPQHSHSIQSNDTKDQHQQNQALSKTGNDHLLHVPINRPGKNVESEQRVQDSMFIKILQHLGLGFHLVVVLFQGTIFALLARYWQSKVFELPALGIQLQNIRLSYLTGLFFIIGTFFLYLKNAVVIDMLPIAIFLFFIAGLSIVHFFINKMKSRAQQWIGLILIYSVILISPKYGLVLLYLLTLIDIMVDLRKPFRLV